MWGLGRLGTAAGTATATVVIAAAVAAFGAAPAVADTCPNNETVLPDTGGDPPYQCAEMHNSDTIKVSSWETDSWTSGPGVGYYNKATCTYKSDSDVTITTADAGSGLGSWTATATNWDVDKHHHYAAGVVWATGNVDNDGYDDGCYKTDDYKDNTGAIENSVLELTSLSLSGVPSTATVGQTYTLTASISPSDATGAVLLLANDEPAGQGTISSGKATIYWIPSTSGEQSLSAAYNFDSASGTVGDKRVSCPSLSKTCGFSAAASSTYEVTVSASAGRSSKAKEPPPLALAGAGAAEPAAASTEAGLLTRNRTREMPGDLSLGCKSGQMPMYATARTDGHGPNAVVRFDGGSAKVVGSKALRGHHVTLQLSCRERSAKLFRGPHLVLGTKRPDKVGTPRAKSGIFGGPGADRLAVTGRGGFAHGGRQPDRIKVTAAAGVATGDPGRDRLKATTRRRALLVGGQSADKLIGGPGPTRINAADGAGGDVVICRGNANKVLADPGDEVRGPCGLLRRHGG